MIDLPAPPLVWPTIEPWTYVAVQLRWPFDWAPLLAQQQISALLDAALADVAVAQARVRDRRITMVDGWWFGEAQVRSDYVAHPAVWLSDADHDAAIRLGVGDPRVWHLVAYQVWGHSLAAERDWQFETDYGAPPDGGRADATRLGHLTRTLQDQAMVWLGAHGWAPEAT